MASIRPLVARSNDTEHRPATELELFFDLVAVIAIATLTAGFHHTVSAGHGGEMFLSFILSFVAIWWLWMNHTWFATGFDNDDPIYRVLTIVIMAGFLLFASGIHNIYNAGGFEYGVIGWTIIRIAMIGLWMRAAYANPELKALAIRNVVGLIFAQSLWILMFFTLIPGTTAFYTATLAVLVVEFSVPVYASKLGNVPWHRGHIIERYGLLNIIVLGEVLLSISLMFGALQNGHFDWALVSTALMGLIVVFSLWWLYFVEEEHLSSDRFLHTFVWGYGHFGIFLAGALLAVGLGAELDLLTHHSHIDAVTVSRYVNGSVALYLASLWMIRDVFHDLGWRRHFLLIAAVVFVLVGYFGAPSWLTAVLSVLTVVLRDPFSKQARVQSKPVPHDH